MDGDCGRGLEIVQARGAALIRERMLSERSEFFLSRIAFEGVKFSVSMGKNLL